MASSFPGGLDNFTTKATGSRVEAEHINAVQDAVKAIEAKIGITGTNDNTSITWKLTDPLAEDPGHIHNGTSLQNILEASISRPGSPILARLAQPETVSGQWTFTGKLTVQSPLHVKSGYSTAPDAANMVAVSAGGLSPNAGAVAWGDGTGWKFHLATFKPSFTPVATFDDRGRVGINVQSPQTALHVYDVTSVTDFSSLTQRGGLTITGPSATNNINALTFTASDNNVQAKLAAVKRTTAYEARLGVSDGAAVTNWIAIDHLGALGIGDVFKSRASIIYGFESWTSDNNRRGWAQAYIANDNGPPFVRLGKSRGTYASALPVNAGDIVGQFMLGGNYITASTPIFNYSAHITATAEQTFSVSAAGTRLGFFVTPLNSATQVEAMRITPAGRIGIMTATVNAEMQFQSTTGRKLVLFENSNSDDDVYGWLVASNLLRHAVPSAARHGIYVGGTQVARFDAAGAVFGDTSVAALASLEIKGAYTVGKKVQLTVTSAGQTFNNINVTGVSVVEFIDGTAGAIAGQAFYITGFANGIANQRLIVRNNTPGILTVKPGNNGSTSGNRIFGFQGTDLATGNAESLMEFWNGGEGTRPWLFMWHTLNAVLQ